jgi:hypothetical protein
MRSTSICLLILAAFCLTPSTRAADDDAATVKKTVKQKVQEINDAIIKADFGTVADLTHPKVVQMMGGRDKMIATMQTGEKDMKSKGFAFLSTKVDDPSDTVWGGSAAATIAGSAELYVTVPFELKMKTPDGKMTVKSFVIGFSTDKGKTWTFVNGDLDPKQIKDVLPNLPDRLKLPEKQKPVMEKD